LWLPHNPRFVAFFCHTFCKQPFFQSDVLKNQCFNVPSRSEEELEEDATPFGGHFTEISTKETRTKKTI